MLDHTKISERVSDVDRAFGRSHPPLSNRGGANFAPSENINENRTIVDWLGFTTTRDDKDVQRLFLTICPGISWSQTHGSVGQGYLYEIQARAGAFVVGWFKYGAGHGRNLLELTGAFGRHWREAERRTDAELVPLLVEPLNGRLSRVDLALDVYDGSLTVEDGIAAHAAGGFTTSMARQAPLSKLIQSDTPDGDCARTLYVGAPRGRKRLRLYDKGLQVLKGLPIADFERVADQLVGYAAPDGQDLRSWVRAELVYKRCKKRPLEPDILVDRDRYFAGAYPVLAEWLGRSDGIRPAYIPQPEDVVVERLINFGRKSYGGLIYHLRNSRRLSDAEIVDLLIADHASAKLLSFDETDWAADEGDVPF